MAFGFFFLSTEWQRDVLRDEWLRTLMANSDTLRVPELIDSQTSRAASFFSTSLRINPGFRAYIDGKYHKIVCVVDMVVACGAADAAAVVAACEDFAAGSRRQWLKVAGDAKADVIDDCLRCRPTSSAAGVVAEFGSFVGYSCSRMAWRLHGKVRVLSLESDAVHVLVARHLVNVARCSHSAEVVAGMAHDSVRRIADEWGAESVAVAFMDHRGTRFHVELQHMERLRSYMPGVAFLADNTLKPGAPVNLWHFLHSTRHAASINWSVPEFVSDECEDWMSASNCEP